MNEHITVLFPITDLAADGAQRQLLELVKGLDSSRFRPVVLTIHPGGAMEPEFKAVPGLRVLSLEQKGKHDFSCLFKTFGILRRMRVDVVQPFLTPATFFGLLPAILSRTPVKIVTERASRGNTSTGLGYRLYLKGEDLLSHFADWCVSNSQAGQEYLIQRGINSSRTKVIYNGINLGRLTHDDESVGQVRQKLGVPSGGKVIGMMARLFPVKNHALFFQSAALIDKAIPDTRFALLGDGPLRGHLEELCMGLGLNSKTVFFGEQRDVATYLAVFDIAVLTSDAEGCSNSLLEAMALGKPVVATDVGGNREVVQHGETGLLVPAKNSQALAEAIITLIRNPKLAQAMGQRGKERAFTQFDMKSMVHKYESLYGDALRKRARESRSVPRPA